MDEESIFTAALGKASPAERQAFLAEACAGDARLRAAVEGLLEAHEHPDSFLEPRSAALPLTVWNRTRSRAEKLAQVARVATSPRDAVRGASVIVTCAIFIARCPRCSRPPDTESRDSERDRSAPCRNRRRSPG